MTSTALDAIRYMRDMIIAADTAAEYRVFTGLAKQSELAPFVVLQIISRPVTPTQDSGSVLDTFRIQVDVFAKSDSQREDAEVAHEIANQIREAVSRTSDGLNYDNAIDSVQEDDLRDDYLPDLDLYNVSCDYFIRIKPGAGDGIVIQNMPVADDTEQVYGLKRWIDGSLIYWRTWYFASGNDAMNTLTGLATADVGIILPEGSMRSNIGDDEVISGVEAKPSGGVYQVFLATIQTEIYITLYYTKN